MRQLHQNVKINVPQIWTAPCNVFGHFSVKLFILQSLLVSFLTSCGRYEDPANRPSPLASDTLKTDQYKLSIAYSSPRVRERKIWNELVPFEKVWRTGANEATVFETSNDLMIHGKRLPKGKYAVFTIPSEDSWTIIFNKDWDQWGAYGYDASKDQLSLTIQPQQNFSHQEAMTFTLKKDRIEFRWENLGYSIPYQMAN
jgi:hypothetical protein